MDSAQVSPHPLLQDPVLHIVDPPKRVKWPNIQKAFEPCGTVLSVGKSPVVNKPNRKKWTIRFSSLFQAEMALATLQGASVATTSSPWIMVLSHSPTLEPVQPFSRLFPQFVKYNGSPLHMGNDVNSQKLFEWFRPAGPLVSVRKDVDVGYAQPAVVLEYWDEVGANRARVQKNALHDEMGRYPAFTVRTFDPCNLYCAGFGATFSQQSLIDTFAQFGAINQATMKKSGVQGSFGFISFMNRDSAAAAIQTVNGKYIDGISITVRYHEPGAQNVFRSRYSSNSAPSGTSTPEPSASSSNTGASSQPDEAQRAWQERQRREAAAQELKEAAERRAREAAAMEAAAAKVKRHEERRARREAAERAEQLAKSNLEAAKTDEENAELEVVLASELKAIAEKALADAKLAVAEAKRVWLEAMERERKANVQAEDASGDLDHAIHKRQQAEACRIISEQEERSFRTAREALDREAEQDAVDEETLRLAELAEKVRRMEELKKIEQQEKEEKERKERDAARAEKERLEREEAERLARVREEAERLSCEQRAREEREREEAVRLAREQREREERERREAETRHKLHQQAIITERARCYKRDMQHYAQWNIMFWDTQRAYQRFIAASEEFDTLKYHETQPLLFESIPWPVLDHPRRMTLDGIEGQAVSQFFSAIKSLMSAEAYTDVMKRTRMRFHPDRWRSRGILNSVLDEGARGQLEAAGNEVSKQINHLWDRRT